MLAKTINQLLKPFGYNIRRIQVDRDGFSPIDRAESAVIEQIIGQFVADANANGGDHEIQAWKSYLTDRRMGFFKHLLAKCNSAQLDCSAKRIADVGSGTGYLLRVIAQSSKPASLTGYDTFEDARILSELICPSGNFIGQSLFEISDNYDFVFCTEVLEHLVDPVSGLNALAEMVVPGGRLILTVPDGRLDQTQSQAIRDDATSYWGHINFWSPESWEYFLKQNLATASQIESGHLTYKELYAIISL